MIKKEELTLVTEWDKTFSKSDKRTPYTNRHSCVPQAECPTAGNL